MTKIVIALLGFLFYSQKSFTQIIWNLDSAISWGDFKGISEKNKDFTAVTTSKIDVNYICNSNCLDYEVYALFYENESWVIDTSNTLLAHEQNHFDITEIFARKIRKYLRESYKSNIADEIMRSNIDQLVLRYNDYQALYDKETNHSLSTKQQYNWVIKIRTQLKQLDKYRDAKYDYCKEQIEVGK